MRDKEWNLKDIGVKRVVLKASVKLLHEMTHLNEMYYSKSKQPPMKKCVPPKIKKYSGTSSSVSVSFIPDWKRFGMTKMDDSIYKIFEKRVFDANICTSPNCKVKFQNEPLPKCTFNSYAKMYTKSKT